jgi:tetratricopeptide (TPR) repeat protein
MGAVQVAISQRDAGRAAELLRSYLQGRPEDWQAHLMLAGVLVSQENLRDGLQHLQLIPDSSDWSIEARFREGSVERQFGRAQAAEHSWLRCLRADAAMQRAPTDIAHAAVVELTILYSLQGRRAELQRVVWAWHDRLPRSQRVRSLIALLNVQFGSPPAAQTAIPELERFVRADDRDFASRRALGRLLVTRPEQAAEGRRLLEECVAARPTHPLTLADYLESLIDLADLPAAHALISSMASSESSELWRLKGIVYQQSGRWEHAAEAFQQSLRRLPNHHVSHARLAEVLHDLGRHADATKHERASEVIFQAEQQLRSANDLFQATERLFDLLDTLTTFTVGELHERAGYLREAQAWYQETLRRDPAHTEAHAAVDRVRKGSEVIQSDSD